MIEGNSQVGKQYAPPDGSAPSDLVEGFCIVDDRQKIQPDSFGFSEDEAWEHFCYPALCRSAFEADGFTAIRAWARPKKPNNEVSRSRPRE